MANQLPPGQAPCPVCGRPVDKLRAAAVAAYEGGFLHFCSTTCKQAYRPGEPRPKRSRSPSTPAPSRPRTPLPAAAESQPEEDRAGVSSAGSRLAGGEPTRGAAADPDRELGDVAPGAAGDEAGASEGRQGEGGAEVDAAGEESQAGGEPGGEGDLEAEGEPFEDFPAEAPEPGEGDEPDGEDRIARDLEPGGQPEPARGHGRGAGGPRTSARHPVRVVWALALAVLVVAGPVHAPDQAIEARVAAAGLALLSLALVALRAALRQGWRAGVEELVALAGAVLTVLAGARQLQAGETALALQATPFIALATWAGRWLEEVLRVRLVQRLCRRTDDPAEAEDLARLAPLLWGDSRAETTASRAWSEPGGGRTSVASPPPTKIDIFTRVAAVRGEGSASMGRMSARAGLYLAVAVPTLAIALLAVLLLGEGSAEVSSLLLAAGTVLALSPRALRRAWVAPMLAAAGRGAARRILFRDGAALEATARAHWVVFDSRGTLTADEPEVTSIVATGGLATEDVLALAAGAEKAAGDNALGAAIVRAAAERGLEPEGVRLARHDPGLGIRATSPKGELLVGTRQLVLGQGISVAEAEAAAAEIEERAETVVFVAVAGHIQGVIGLRDELRPGSRRVAADLVALGVEPVLMTGDSRSKADALGNSLGFDHVRAEVSPEQWAEQIGSLRETEHGIAMVARPPRREESLAAADVGLALGAADLDSEAAGVALVSDDPSAAVEAVAIARRALRASRRNVFVAATQVLVGLGLAWLALGLLQQWAVPAVVAALASFTAAVVSSEALAWRLR